VVGYPRKYDCGHRSGIASSAHRDMRQPGHVKPLRTLTSHALWLRTQTPRPDLTGRAAAFTGFTSITQLATGPGSPLQAPPTKQRVYLAWTGCRCRFFDEGRVVS
jgi:hypothetical protein